MTPEIKLDQLVTAAAEGATIVDVREPEEYRVAHVPGAVLMPLSSVHARLGEVPRGEPIFVICASGNRSKAATDWMRAAGIEAFSVAGGTAAWARAGHPIARER